MSVVDRLREHVDEHGGGMVYDLLFAVVWVALVNALFDFVFTGAPTWAFYMFLAAGIPAYFGFFYSLGVARQHQE